MVEREDDGYWLVLTEVIAFHHEEVFACLTTDAGLMRWFPVAAEVDLEVGGRIVFGWDNKFTKKTTISILEYDAGGAITWDWYSSSDDTHAPVYWSVEPDHEEGSRVTMRQGPFKETIEGLIALADEADSWRWQLCNLRTVLESKHDMRRVRPL